MSAMNPPKKGVAYECYVSVLSQANANIFQASPTMAAGDVKVSIDNAASANITTLPAIGTIVKTLKVNLSAAEMNGDNIIVLFSDAAGNEWCDLLLNIQTTTAKGMESNIKAVNDITVSGSGTAASPWGP